MLTRLKKSPQKACIYGLNEAMILQMATNESLAEKAGVSASTIVRIRKGEEVMLHLATAVQEAVEGGGFKFKRKPPFKGGHPVDSNPWVKVVFAVDCEPCDCCNEPWCEKHNEHYADCDCVGPDQTETHEYKTEHGILYARNL